MKANYFQKNKLLKNENVLRYLGSMEHEAGREQTEQLANEDDDDDFS